MEDVHNAFNRMADIFKTAEEKSKKAVLIASSLLPRAEVVKDHRAIEEAAGHLMFLDEHRLDSMIKTVKKHGYPSLDQPAVDEMAKNVQRKIVWNDDTTNPQGGTDGNQKSPT